MKRIVYIILLVSIFLMPITTFAQARYVIPGGENVGIELRSRGVVVVGFYRVNGTIPAKEAGLREGDVIRSIDNQKIGRIEDMVKALEQSEDNVSITFARNNREYRSKMTLEMNDGNAKTGLYVKDNVTGIGTLTYIDPKTKNFGVLGHEIVENKSNRIFAGDSGTIFQADVRRINKSTRGNPGGKSANFHRDNVYGEIAANTNKGIYGTFTDALPDKKKKRVANPQEVKLGEATISTVLKGNKIREYDIKIIHIDHSNDTKNILFDVVDNDLIKQTGGIVQGMSGSPILQDGMIVGAVTHVVVDEPTKGYGIFITSMIEEGNDKVD